VPGQMGQNPILGIYNLAVDVDHIAFPVLSPGFFQFFSYVLGDCRFAGTCFSVDEDIGWGFSSQSRHKN